MSDTLILAGDFNQLDDVTIVNNTGLISLVKKPTRGPNCLDRIYISKSCDVNIYVIKSLVKSDHCCVILQDSFTEAPTIEIKSQLNTFRSRTPEQFAAFLSGANTFDFSSVFTCFEPQNAFNYFYDILNSMLDKYFPLRSVVRRSCDAPFMTGEVKTLLRKKNRLMQKGKVEHASSLATKIGSLIAKFNSSRLSQVTSGTFNMWAEVKKLTGTSKTLFLPDSLNATTLNQHYKDISKTCNINHYNMHRVATQDSSMQLATVNEMSVFHLLDKLKCTAAGPDNIPFWFLKLAAPIISAPLTFLINCSLSSGIVPEQWKIAVINPIPKITTPAEPSDMRPISVVPILSRITERLVINEIRPAFHSHPLLKNQFAYQPNSSTTAALIAILSHITTLLETNTHVHLISFDYSKAFDTLSHAAVSTGLANFNIPYNIQNWIQDYLENRKHYTIFKNTQSIQEGINSGIVQGSVLGPTLFNITSTSLSTISPHNKYFKYADDGYLIVPGSNSETISLEIDHHAAWAIEKNLKLNLSKTHEMIFCRKRTPPPQPTSNITRVSIMKILGIHIDDKLTFLQHVAETIKACSQSFFALRTMKQHGMPTKSLQLIFISKIISKLTYASPAWWGFLNESSKNQLEAVLRRAKKFGYYDENGVNLVEYINKLEITLFRSIVENDGHILRQLLPPHKQTAYNTRKRGHNFALPKKDNRNFINRALYTYL